MNQLRYSFCISKQFEYLYGINPIMASLYANRREFYELYVNQSQQNDYLNPKIGNIINKANQLKIPVQMIPKKKLERFCNSSSPHQNVILKCSPINYVQEINDNQDIVMLDQVQDPQNFGAILRVCYYLGINQVVVSQSGNCPLSPTVSKTSSGALEMMDIYQTNDLIKFTKQRKPTHTIYGTGFEKNSIDYNLISADKTKLKLIILGSEGYGVRLDLLKICDYILNIPSKRTEFPETLVDSLNVSVSTGIILSHLLKE